jgi:hypothetical protein
LPEGTDTGIMMGVCGEEIPLHFGTNGRLLLFWSALEEFLMLLD